MTAPVEENGAAAAKAGAVRRWGLKTGLVTSACIAFGLGLIASGVFLGNDDVVVESIGWLSGLFEWAQGIAERYGTAPDKVALARLITVVAVDLLAFVLIVVVLCALMMTALAPRAGAAGEGSSWATACAVLTQSRRSAGIVQLVAGAVMAVACCWFLLRVADLATIRWLLPAIAGTVSALAAIGLATLIPLPVLLDDVPPLPEEPVPEPLHPEARLTGDELLEALRSSPIYRRQVVVDRVLPGQGHLSGKGMQALLRRYPLLGPTLAKTSIRKLTDSQSNALARILAAETGSGPRDFSLVGWSGTGRGTLANLIALGAVLHREGAMYCLTPEGPEAAVDQAGEGPGVRHPRGQLDHWLKDTPFEELVSIQEAYSDRKGSSLTFGGASPDIVMTDVRCLEEQVLAHAVKDSRPLVQRLRYVVIDHPNRLGREDLVRLRIAIARLRLTAELLGARLSFIVLLPWLDNHVAFSNWLLNNDDVQTTEFTGWSNTIWLLGWLPPPELHEFSEDESPTFVRAEFTAEAIGLLSEVGYLSHRLRQDGQLPLRVAVIDSQPLLGPDFREHLRSRINLRLGREIPEKEDLELVHSWSYYATSDLAVDHERCFDVVVCFGLGGRPDQLVPALRGALATEGALILMGDSSPEDYESLRRVAEPSWTPERIIESREHPRLVIPAHSEAVIAHELATLFADFRGYPIPRRRLLGAFPNRHTATLLEEWESEEEIERIWAFGLPEAGLRPPVNLYLRRINSGFHGDRYAVPWGCTSRRVLRLFNVDAKEAASPRGRHHSEFVDHDRLFIDYYPGAVRRYSPSTVVVENYRPKPASERGDVRGAQRFVDMGWVDVASPGQERAVEIDRRRLRVQTELLDERSLRPAPVRESDEVQVEADAAEQARRESLAGALRPAATGATSGMGRLLDDIETVLPSGGAGDPPLLVEVGHWACRLSEQIRDVPRTDLRLVEEPLFTYVAVLRPALKSKLRREFEAVGVSLFLRARAGWQGESDSPTPPNESYPASHGLGRILARFLRRQFVNFDDEYRLALVPNRVSEGDAEGGVSGWRILFHHLRDGEVDSDRHVFRLLVDPHKLRDFLDWAHSRLEGCICEDGCSLCVGGLGVVPKAQFDGAETGTKYSEADVVSRAGAYELVCGMRGTAPRWDRFRDSSVIDEGADITDVRSLRALVAELIGTPTGDFRDGLWFTLFREHMPLGPDKVAEASWMGTAPDQISGCAGYYSSNDDSVHVGVGYPMSFTRQIIVHEYAHHWQYQKGLFDLDELSLSEEAGQYFDGKLVIEGHATWAETQLRFHHGQGPVMTPRDGRTWNEYKVGYFLIEAIEKAVGERGLFAWLAEGQDASKGKIRSAVPGLQWPFTLTEALKKLKVPGEDVPLIRIAVGRSFGDDFDIFDGGATDVEEPAEPAE